MVESPLNHLYQPLDGLLSGYHEGLLVTLSGHSKICSGRGQNKITTRYFAKQ